jgi:hypothetical protein
MNKNIIYIISGISLCVLIFFGYLFESLCQNKWITIKELHGYAITKMLAGATVGLFFIVYGLVNLLFKKY